METSYIKFIQKSKINYKSYFLYGNEEVLRQDCSELISKNFCSEGCSKLVTFGLDGFDNLEEEILKLSGGSLFQEKLIIKIKHLEGRFPEILKKLIEEDKFNTNDQNVFIIESAQTKLNKTAKWVKALDANLEIINCNKLNIYEEKLWLKNQLSFLPEKYLSVVGSAIHNNFTGNLLMQKNEVSILKLVEDEKIEETIKNYSVMQNHEIFDLENAIICTDFDRARKIINSIRNNNSSVPPLVSWILSKVISSCYGIKSSKGKPNLYDLGIWRDVQSEYMSFSNKIDLNQIDSLANAFLLDKSSKGIHPINSWNVLETIISDLENSLLSN